MSEIKRSFLRWNPFLLVTTLGWLIGLPLAAAVMAAFLPAADTLTTLFLTGLIAGTSIALASWITLPSRPASVSRWAAFTVFGLTTALFASYAAHTSSPTLGGGLIAALLSGAVTGSLQSLAFQRQARNPGLATASAFGWTGAYVLGRLLSGTSPSLPGAVSFLASFWLGWSVVALILLSLLVALAPLPRAGYPRGRVRWL